MRQTIRWTFILFMGTILLTMENDAYQDGHDRFGFPFTFYDYFGGICNNCYDQYGFKIFYFVADVALIAITAYLFVRLKNNLTR